VVETLPLHRGDLYAPTEKPTPEALEIMRQIVADNEQVLHNLHRGAVMEQARYPIDLSAVIIHDEEHWTKIRRAAILLAVESEARLDAGDVGRATETILTMVGLARTLDRELVVMSYLIRESILNIAVGQFERMVSLSSGKDVEFETLAASFEAAESASRFDRVLAGELASMGVKYQRPISQWSSEDEIEAGKDWKYYFLAGSGMMERAYLAVLKRMKVNLEISQFPTECRVDAFMAANPDSDVHVSDILAWADLFLMENYPRLAQVDLQTIASLRLARTAVAVMRFTQAEGHLPDELMAIAPKYIDAVPMDPFTGAPLHYVNHDQGFVLYSVGDDVIDNDGKRYDADGHEYQPGTDIVFEVTR
jgi:hypothetical protein